MSIRIKKQSKFNDLFSGQVGEKVTLKVLSSMLRSYFASCKYLQEAIFNNDGCLEIAGKFCIPNPCYVKSTGHFNAVEFIICFDQLCYVLFGESVRRGLIPEMGFDSMEDCQKTLLSTGYTKKIKKIRFKKQIDPMNFTGYLHVRRRKTLGKYDVSLIEATFEDSNGGIATGLIMICLRKE